MSCSVRTGSTGSGGELKSVSYNFSVVPKGLYELNFSEAFPNITPKYVKIDNVSFGVAGGGGYGQSVSIGIGANAINIFSTAGSVNGTVSALY